MSKTMGVSPITDTIYYGTVKNNMWQGKKEDVTDMAIKAVFEWFMHKLDNECPDGAYQIRFPSVPYVLEMKKEESEEKMSDLISKSVLIKVLKDRATNEAIMGYMTAYDVTNSIIDEVEEQPTAYDINNVIEELERNASRYTKKYVTPYGNNGYKDTKAISIHKAIEIVKQGGVGKDT